MGAAWHIHFVDSQAALADLREPILASLDRAEARVIAAWGPLSLDIVVQNMPGRVIPQLGFVGYAPTASLIYLTLDATNENLAGNIGMPLERTVVHEVNHVLRWRGPGYGATLGEAIVSEGLAGHFTREVFDNDPEPWEVPRDDDPAYLGDLLAHWADPYDHNAWFFGSDDKPHWLGYRLGYRIVGQHLARSGQTARALTQAPVIDFLETVRTMAA